MIKNLLKQLSVSNLVKVTGSYADGTNHEFSDIDFYVKTPREVKVFGGRNTNFEKIIKILEEHKIKIYGMPFGFSTIPPGGVIPNKSEIYMDFSDAFVERPNKRKEVEILGNKFKTH